MKQQHFLVAPLAMLALTACDNANLQTRLDQHSTDIQALQYGQRHVLNELGKRRTAILDPTYKGYSLFDCDAGRLLVSCDEVVQYLDGHKIIFHIGNPLTMTFNGFKLKVRYGTRAPAFPSSTDGNVLLKWQQANEAWQKALKQKDISFSETLNPGSWNRIEVILSPAKTEEVAHLELSLQIDQVSLFQPK